jgi:hypothetical protein
MKIENVNRYGTETFENTSMDSFRHKECMCYHCRAFSIDSEENCPVAQQLYKICVENNMAMIITRCKFWEKT